MATTALNDNQAALLGLVRRWDRRQRLAQSALWLPRAALPGLAVGVVLAVIARLRPFLLPETIAAITLALVAAGMLIALAVIWLRDRSAVRAARRFDVLFGLNERVSTALELLDGRIHTQPELAARQLEDARLTARAVRARDHLPLRAGRGDLALLVALGLALVLLLALPNVYSEALAIETSRDAAEEAAIAEAAETVRDLTEQVASDPDLRDEERQPLLQVLEESARALNDPNVSPEEAFAEMSNVQNTFQQTSDLLERQLAENAAALQAASDALREIAPPGEGQDLSSIERMLQQMEMMRQLAEQMGSQPGPPGTGQAMQSAGDALSQSGDPMMQQAGQSMQNAADAMQQGDQAAAQQSLNDAQNQLEQARQQQQGQQQAQQNTQQGAQQAQQSASQINEAQQGSQPGQNPQQQQGQQSQQGQQQGNSQGQQQGQQGQTGQQGQNQQSNQQGQGDAQGQTGQAQQGSSGAQNGQQQQGAGESAANAQGQQPGALSGTALRSEGSGAGDNPGGEAIAQPGTGDIQANNNPDGLGQGAFEPIYAPQRIGGAASGEQLVLEPDTENAPVVEGEFSENPNGTASVPYNEVFRQYLDAASRNLDTGYVPLGLRDVVRNYFTSLEPGR